MSEQGRALVPVGELHPGFSSNDAVAVAWSDALRVLETSELFWVSTVRPEGRPHVTPLIAIWLDNALHFCTGADERKGRNLAENPHCVLTTGDNTMSGGLDIVVEGTAVQVTEEAALTRLAAAFERKYGDDWRFTVDNGAFRHHGGRALAYAVDPTVVFGFGKAPFSQTRWRFREDAATTPR